VFPSQKDFGQASEDDVLRLKADFGRSCPCAKFTVPDV
jgi:hypothetical protein